MEDNSRETHDGALTPDSDYLGAIGCGSLVIGWVPEVNGEGALEAKEFVPTRHELSIIARHWLREGLKIKYQFFCEGQTSRDGRVLAFAQRRVSRIENILEEDAMERIFRDVMSELEAEGDPRLWKMCLSGEKPERDGQGKPVLPPLESANWHG